TISLLTARNISRGRSLTATFPQASTWKTTANFHGSPLSAGSYTFTVRVRNKAGSSTRTFTIVVPYITPKEPPIIKTTSLTGGTKGIPYGFQLTADGTAPITWLADDFPAGLALSSTGYISGTPSASGTFSLSFTASNDYGTDSRTLSLTVAEPPSGTKPSITTDTLDPATAGTAYSYQLGVSGTPPFTWTLKGKLPDGLSMSDSGLITGTPTKKGSKKFTITAKNDSGEEKKKLTLTVYELPEILTETLKDATLGKKYKQALKANGAKPLTWELDGNLPEGITFDAEKGKFSGTPTQTTTGAVNITLTNSAGSVSQTYTLKVSGTPPKIGLSKLKDGKYGKSYKANLKVKGSEPITLTLVGELPEGLSFDSEEGTITGTPTEACTDREIRVIASNAADIVSKDYTLTIKAVAPKFQTKKLPDAVKGKEYSADIAVTGTPEITFSASGLPSGLTISNDGTISGTPTEFGKFKVSVTAANSAKTAKKNMKLVVLAAPELSGSGTLTSGTQGKSYKHTFSATGSKTITFSIAGGSLPGGLSLNAKGKLSGKPKSAGTYTFTVKAANSAGEDSKDFTLTITASTSNKSAGTYTENGTAVDVKSYVDAESYNSGSYVDVERYSGEKYIVVAELPEVSADISGMYDFSVELDENAQAGEKLYWLANSEAPSADDDIAEFFDEDGLEIDSVPENRKVNISVWLNAGTTYKPVIAVKR
ncbi:MAG: putative Ig domain-containing protein, partial [Synergistaceae bacterium]|nr:putative Ig domain-containing protein [Synergistaceae bacterium]